MASYNRVVLMGNLTRDPELRYIPSGMAVSDIGMAINDRVKRNDQWTEEVTFVDVTLWGRTAEVANEYLSKGSSVLIEGRLKLDTWEKDGQKRSKLKVVGEKMQMVGSKGGGGGGQRASGGSFQGQQSYQGQSSGDAMSDQGQPAYSDAMASPPSGQPSNQPPAPSMPPNDEIPF